MRTVSFSIANYCVPCHAHCRYCLLSSCGQVSGVDYRRSEELAHRVLTELAEKRPDISGSFYIGYCMDTTDLWDYINFSREHHSLGASFLQMNGFGFREATELLSIMQRIREAGVYNRLLKQGLSVKTVRNVHGVGHASLERAVKTDLLNKNVSDSCVLPRVRQAEMHPLQGDEVARFLEAIKGDDFEDLYYVTLFTGMRQGEALGLTWDSVLFDQECLHLHHQLQKERKQNGVYRLVELKNSQDRYVQLPPQVTTVLQRIKDEQSKKQKESGSKCFNPLGLVFVDEKGGHLSKVTTYNHLKRIAKKMGKPELRYHDLRHSWTVIMLTVGASVKAVSTMLGHATVAFTLDRYGHTTDPMRKDAADRMSDYIRGVTEHT